MADVLINKETAITELPPEFGPIKGTPFKRTLQAVLGLKENPPHHLENVFAAEKGLSPQQTINHAFICGDEWFTQEYGIRKKVFLVPQEQEYTKNIIQKNGYEEVAKIIGPHLTDQKFMTTVIKQLLKRYREATPEQKNIFEQVPLFCPFNPLGLWYPELD